MAGTIAALADNAVGGAGVAPEAKVLPVKIFGGLGSQASSTTIAQAFDYAGALGVDVVNASLGGIGSSQFVTDVIASHPGTLYVVAAGNDGVDAATFFPCNSAPRTSSASARPTTATCAADFSNFNATVVDLFAPGSYIALEHPERRVHVRERDVDGEPARRGCRGAAGGRRSRTPRRRS